MAGLTEWWQSLPRSKQLMVAFAAFWVLFMCAAVYEWLAPGSLAGPFTMTGAQGMTTGDPFALSAAEAGATAIVVRQGPTSGDLLVLAVLGFIVIMLGAVGTLAWRETHGTGRQPGMGSGDDPLWSGGDHDGPSWTTDQA
jgi:hypothetical protein